MPVFGPQFLLDAPKLGAYYLVAALLFRSTFI